MERDHGLVGRVALFRAATMKASSDIVDDCDHVVFLSHNDAANLAESFRHGVTMRI